MSASNTGMLVIPQFTVEERLQYAQNYMLNILPETGLMLYYTRKYLTTHVSTLSVTVYVDGVHVYINPNFVKTVTDSELIFILVHEMMHVYCYHCNITDRFEYLRRDDPLLITAQEMVVNELSKRLLATYKFDMSSLTQLFSTNANFLPDNYTGTISVEAVYQYLLDHPDIQRKESIFSVSLISKNMKSSDDPQNPQQIMKTKTNHESCNSDSEIQQDITHIQEAIEILMDKSGNGNLDISGIIGMSGIENKQLRAIAQVLVKPDTSYLTRIKLMSRGRNHRQTYAVMNKYQAYYDLQGIVAKGKRYYLSEIVYLLDVSASRREFAKKSLSYLYDSELRYTVIQIDTTIQKIDHVKGRELLDVEIIDGGGTDLQPAIDYIATLTKKPDVLVIITDGQHSELYLAKLGNTKIFIVSNDVLSPIADGKAEQKIITLL